MDNTEVNISQEIPAYERRYRKISEWFLNCKPVYAILKFIYKYMAYFIAFAYIFLIIMSLRGTFFSETTPIMLRNSGIVVETDKFLLTSKLILTPFTSFILVSVIRKCIDAKRPYEKYNIKPLFVKDTKGDSMPSRHVFSITIIAMCWLYVSVPVGIIMLMLVAIMAASRVLAGVHFVRISSVPFSFCPDLISFTIDEHIVSQSDKAVAYSSYFFFGTTPEFFIIFSCESTSLSKFAMVCS